jgi:hypothetical protein
MWLQFADLGPYERSVIDTSRQVPGETADQLWARLSEADPTLAFD